MLFSFPVMNSPDQPPGKLPDVRSSLFFLKTNLSQAKPDILLTLKIHSQ